MKYDYHEERRAKESAERMREEAIKFAENQKHENERLKKLIEVGGKALTSASQARVDSDLVTAEKLYKDAYDNGDSEGMLQAQKKIATLTYEKNKISETPVNGVWKEPVQQQPQQQQHQQLQWEQLQQVNKLELLHHKQHPNLQVQLLVQHLL